MPHALHACVLASTCMCGVSPNITQDRGHLKTALTLCTSYYLDCPNSQSMWTHNSLSVSILLITYCRANLRDYSGTYIMTLLIDSYVT